MKRKISILFAICLLCALASGCSGEKSVSKVELPAVVPESPAQESVAPESTAQDLPEQNNSAPSQADVELDVPDAPEGKTTLVLGGIGLRDDTLASLVNNFNAENTKYTVVIDDYAENTQTREQAETVMQTKLFAGDAADIYYFRNDMLSPLPWISAGLLYDLDPLIASDSEISEEDIIPWTAMHEYGGLYLLSPTFGVVALSCSQQTQQLHTSWTITEYLDIEKSLRPEQDMIYYMNPENFLERIGGRYLRGVIDYEHAQCNLDTPEFREILQSALKAGSYDGGYSPDKNVPQRIVDGELICCYVGLSSALEVSFDRYRCGQTLGYVGWPTPDGSNGMDVRLMMPLGVSATTSCPEGCWEFLKYLLLHPWMEYSADGTPVYAPLLQDNLDVLKNIEVPYAEITTFDDVQLIVNLAETCETMDFYDEAAMAILLEEMGDLVSGNIDLDTAVERMQSRLNLYLMEQVK